MADKRSLSKVNEVFVKKYWDEEGVLFYLHFQNGKAVSQIEISNHSTVFLSIEKPFNGDSMLYDQSLENLNLNESDFISKDEYFQIWEDEFN